MKSIRLRAKSRTLLRLAAALLCAALLCALSGCKQAGGGASSSSEPEVVGGSTKREAVTSRELQFVWPADDAVFATLETSKGVIRLVLFPQQAPLAVENFCTLAELGYYDGTEFHRVVRDFVIQGGDATGTGTGGQTIWGDVYDTEISDALHHYSGALCAAPVNGQPDTHNSQFYIVATPQGNVSEATVANLLNSGVRAEVAEAYRQAGGAPYLDYTDTVFGHVIEGMDVVDAIARVAVDEDHNRPKSPVLIEKITLANWPPPPRERDAPREPEQVAAGEGAAGEGGLLDDETDFEGSPTEDDTE